jgi:hypothetical protein
MNEAKNILGAAALLLLGAACFIGCGSDAESPAGGQGGTSSTGGQSSTSTGGGSATDTLAAAMSLNFLSGGVNCPIPVGYDDFPAVAGGHPVTATGASATTPDNVTSPRGLVHVQCTIGASLLQGTISLGGGTVNMGFVTSRSGNYGSSLSYTPLDSKVIYRGNSTSACTVTALSTTATGGLYSVVCPTLAGDDNSTSCVLGESYVYFEGCTLQ